MSTTYIDLKPSNLPVIENIYYLPIDHLDGFNDFNDLIDL